MGVLGYFLYELHSGLYPTTSVLAFDLCCCGAGAGAGLVGWGLVPLVDCSLAEAVDGLVPVHGWLGLGSACRYGHGASWVVVTRAKIVSEGF